MIVPGMIVTVPLRKKSIHALVIASVSLTEAKSMVKTSDFAMRKVTASIGPSPISPTTLAAFRTAANYVSTSVGVIIANTVSTDYVSKESAGYSPSEQKTDGKLCVLQDSSTSRIKYYTQQAINSERLVIITPTDAVADRIAHTFSKDITVFHVPQKLTKTKLNKVLQAFDERPSIVIGTPTTLGFIDRIHPTIVVIEHESDNRYIRQRKPHIDMRMIAELLVTHHGLQGIVADTLVRAYTHARVALGQLQYSYKPVYPNVSQAHVLPYIKDTVKEKDSQTAKHPFFSPELLSLLKNSTEPVVVYVPRKGIAPSVVCQDCGVAIVCDTCGLPHKLIQKKDASGNRKNFYVCKYPEHMIPAYNTCRNCTGHRLVGLGITTMRMRETLQALLPHRTVYILDQDETPTEKDQKSVINAYKSDTTGILVATSLVIPYIDRSVKTIIIPSLDMLLSQSNPEAIESIARTLAVFEEMTTADTIVQTRLPENDFWNHIRNNTLNTWMSNDITLRNQYKIPPFSTTLAIYADLTLGTTAQFQKNIEALGITQSSISVTQGRKKNQLIGNAVLRLAPSQWNMDVQDRQLAALLSILPPNYHVEIRTDA